MRRTSPRAWHGSCVAAAALLLAYAYSTAGFASLHLMAREGHRRDVRAALHSGESEGLVRISIPRADLPMVTWLSDDEFRLDGHLYDIVEKTETADSLLLLCFDDVAERELEMTFAHHLRPSGTEGGAAPLKAGVPGILPHRASGEAMPTYAPPPGIHPHQSAEALPTSPLLDQPHPPPWM